MKFYFCVLISFFVWCSSYSQSDSNSINSLLKRAKTFEDNNQNDSALNYQNKALLLSQSSAYKLGVARSLSAMGRIQMHKGKYPEALDCFFKALQLYEEIKSRSGELIQLGNIGIVYDNQGDLQKALDYYFKALSISESINDLKHASIQHCNIAIVYLRRQDHLKAKEFFFKALAMDKQLHNQEGVARNLSNIGSVFTDQGEYNSSLEYHLKALSEAKELNDPFLLASSMANVGSVYGFLKNPDKAEFYLLQSLKEAEKAGDLDLKSQLELITSEVYEDMKNAPMALKHYKNHVKLRDSVYNEENTKKSVRSEMNYIFEKKAAATKYENDIRMLKLESDNLRQKQLRIFLIIILALMILLLFFGKRAYDAKKIKAEFMAAENNRKEVLLQEVHHRINNNLQIISSLLTLQANSVEDEKLNEYLKQSQNRIQSLAALHELLYHNDSPLQINMHQYLNKVLDFHRNILQTLSCKVIMEVNVTEASFPTKLAVPVALIVNELVTNAIKYAFQGKETGKIRVSLEPFLNESDSWVLGVNDNGNGLPAQDQVRKDSLGIKLVNILSKQIKGSITKNNNPGASFEIVFSKPQ